MSDHQRRSRPSVRALISLAWAHLRHERTRSIVAVCGVTLAVLSMTLLAGGGMGVLTVGEQQFQTADRDLWVTSGPIGLTTTGGGGFTNGIQDAHEVAGEIESHEEVRNAAPMAFQSVYVSSDGDSFETIVGSGVPGGGSSIALSAGEGFSSSDRHYANGTYDGPMTNEVVIDNRTAQALNVSVGETIHVGGTLAAARDSSFTVVGISPTFSQFLAAPTVTLYLSELQTVTGTAGTDAATMITVTLEEGADQQAVKTELEQAHPSYDIRTNREQLEAVLSQQAIVIAGAVLLVGLAVVSGAALTVSLLSLFIYQHRAEIRMLSALGLSPRTTAALVVVQGFFIACAGWLLGALLSLPLSTVLNAVVSRIIGYEGLVIVSPQMLVVSGVIAIGIGSIASLIAVWRLPTAGPPTGAQ